MCATNDGEANGASLFCLGDLLGCARRGLPSSSCAAELFSVGEDEVHVLDMSAECRHTVVGAYLVEGEHLPDHLPSVLKCHLHAVVDLRIVSGRRELAGWRALTRFCYIKARQSVSMRVFSQVTESRRERAGVRLTILPCLLAAAMVVGARPRTTGDSENREQRESARKALGTRCRRGKCPVDVELHVGHGRASKLRSPALSQPSHSSSAPHDRPQPSPNYHRTFASPTSLRQSTSPTNTVAVTMVCARQQPPTSSQRAMLIDMAVRLQGLQPHAGASHPEARPQHLRRRVW